MTSGLAVIALGAVGLFCAFVLEVVMRAPLGFIDAHAMVLVSAVFIVVGAWMVRSGRRPHGEI